MKTYLFLLLLLLSGCAKEKPHAYTFYYWKTKLSLSNTEKKALQTATTPVLYTRFFDVDKTGGKFQPVAMVTKDNSFGTGKRIIPVVFITNRTFLFIQKEEIYFLAESISKLIEKKTREFGFPATDEIQIDCDWTAGTRDDYFAFLKELGKVSKKNITSTLRLHQVKDRQKMGIPPVQKVYLMCYSTSSPLENSDKNSILDLALLKNYLSDVQDYPVRKMDIALPIWSWGIITNHTGRHKLINALSADDLNRPDFEKISDTEAIVKKDGFYFGYFLNKGFRIRIEEISDQQLDEAVRFLNGKNIIFNLIYYQLDERFLKGRNLLR